MDLSTRIKEKKKLQRETLLRWFSTACWTYNKCFIFLKEKAKLGRDKEDNKLDKNKKSTIDNTTATGALFKKQKSTKDNGFFHMKQL